MSPKEKMHDADDIPPKNRAQTAIQGCRGAAEPPWENFGLRAQGFVASLEGATLDATLDAAAAVLDIQSTQAELADFVRSELPPEDQVERCIEIAIAHGSGGWPEPWQGAGAVDGWSSSWIAKLVEHETRGVMRWFEGVVAGGISWGGDDRHFAAMSAYEMMWGLVARDCNCVALTSRTDHRANARNARRMRERHDRDHCLASWRPEQGTLWEFLANAVRGRGGMRAGSIRQGMFYPQLVETLGLRVGNVPMNYCIDCHDTYARHEQICGGCGANGDRLGTPTVLRRRFIVDGAAIHKQKWWRCRPCEAARRLTRGRLDSHAFPDTGDAGVNEECPLCGETARGTGKKRAEVYTRVDFDHLD